MCFLFTLFSLFPLFFDFLPCFCRCCGFCREFDTILTFLSFFSFSQTSYQYSSCRLTVFLHVPLTLSLVHVPMPPLCPFFPGSSLSLSLLRLLLRPFLIIKGAGQLPRNSCDQQPFSLHLPFLFLPSSHHPRSEEPVTIIRRKGDPLNCLHMSCSSSDDQSATQLHRYSRSHECTLRQHDAKPCLCAAGVHGVSLCVCAFAR